MASTMFADQETTKMIAARPTPVGEAGADEVIEAVIYGRAATRVASIARIEALLEQVDDPVLADLWRQICPLHVDQLPDRQGMIVDLADFAEVLEPRLNGMKAWQLCKLIEAYAAKRRRSLRFLRGPSPHLHAGQRRTTGPSRITRRERIRSAFPRRQHLEAGAIGAVTEVHCRQDQRYGAQHDAYPPSDRAFDRRIALDLLPPLDGGWLLVPFPTPQLTLQPRTVQDLPQPTHRLLSRLPFPQHNLDQGILSCNMYRTARDDGRTPIIPRTNNAATSLPGAMIMVSGNFACPISPPWRQD